MTFLLPGSQKRQMFPMVCLLCRFKKELKKRKLTPEDYVENGRHHTSAEQVACHCLQQRSRNNIPSNSFNIPMAPYSHVGKAMLTCFSVC
jgi:hypothetical protein